MTPLQQTVLALVNKLNAAEFGGWFKPEHVMAFVQVESAFRPDAYRYEPRLRQGSFGLMQVLASTALSVDPALTDPDVMYDPETGLRIGMKVARLYWDQEARHFGRDPTLHEWAASYNEGVGGAERDVLAHRDPDPAYTKVWDAAVAHWTEELANMQSQPPGPYAATIPDLVRMLQIKLNEASAAPQLVVDGDPGPRTRDALKAWQQSAAKAVAP